VLTQDCTNKDEFSSQENTLFKKMAKTGIRHIAEKSADIIDPVQNENSK
jgi:4-hydroxyphenylpyruvate dioxygenase-like putative hemolysin